MSFPQEVHVEFYINGAWIDVSQYVQMKNKIYVKYGRSDELSNVTAAECKFTLRNTNGIWSPRNPLGQYYGYLTKNLPMRVYLLPHFTAGEGQETSETFTRTASNWNGGTYTYTHGGAGGTIGSDWACTGSLGTQSVPVANAYRYSILEDVVVEDVEVTATINTPSISLPAGGSVEPGNILLRVSESGGVIADYYTFRVEVTTSGLINVAIMGDHASTVLAAASLAFGYAASQPLKVKARAIGNELSFKVWSAAGSEPTTWDLVAHDSALAGPLRVAFRDGVASGNTDTKPVVFSWDDITVTPFYTRFVGEIAELPPTWDHTSTNAMSSVAASGILRRLNQGSKSARAPIERATTSLTPLVYWPLTDGVEAQIGGTLSNTQDWFSVELTTIGFSKVTGPIGAPASLPEMVVDREFVALTTQFTQLTGDFYTIYCIWKGIPVNEDDVWKCKIMEWTDDQNNIFTFGIEVDTYSTYYVAYLRANNQLVTSIDLSIDMAFDLANSQWRHIQIQVEYTSGTNTTAILLLVDDTYYNTDTQVGFVAGNIRDFSLYSTDKASPNLMSSVSIGHVSVYSGEPSSTLYVNPVYDAMNGYTPESLNDRIARLEVEDNVGIHLTQGAASPDLASQRTVGFVQLMQDIQAGDLGILSEARNAAALHYRTLTSLYNQTPYVLDHSLHHLSEPPEVTDDDQRTWNSVTVERWNGAKYRTQETSGALNISPPPDGVGEYDRGLFTSHISADDKLPDVANWLKMLGTIDEERYPLIKVDRARQLFKENDALSNSVLRINIGDIIGLDGLPVYVPPDRALCAVQGYSELFNQFTHEIGFVSTPGSAYTVGVYGGSASRYGANGSTLTSSLSSSATSFTVAYTGYRWVRSADSSASFPLQVMVGGEVITISDISGTSSPQTFTVSARAVNGIVKAHAAGTPVNVYLPTKYALGRRP